MTDLICIVCPRGCHLHVDEANQYQVTGNSCPRGAAYGKSELVNPTRVLTSIVRVTGASLPCCSVKTSAGIPKALTFPAMKALQNITLTAPVHIGDVVAGNICGTGVDWIATRNL